MKKVFSLSLDLNLELLDSKTDALLTELSRPYELIPKKIHDLYVIESVIFSLLPYIPLSAWKESHYFSWVASSYT